MNLNLTYILDSLMVFSGQPASLQICYKEIGGPLVFMLQDGSVVTDASIQTQEAEEPSDFGFPAEEVANEATIESSYLAALDCGEGAKGTMTIYFWAEGIRISTVTDHGSFEVDFPRSCFAQFDCHVEQAMSYGQQLFQPTLKAVPKAVHTCIRLSTAGILSVTHRIRTDAETRQAFVEYFLLPTAPSLPAALQRRPATSTRSPTVPLPPPKRHPLEPPQTLSPPQRPSSPLESTPPPQLPQEQPQQPQQEPQQPQQEPQQLQQPQQEQPQPQPLPGGGSAAAEVVAPSQVKSEQDAPMEVEPQLIAGTQPPSPAAAPPSPPPPQPGALRRPLPAPLPAPLPQPGAAKVGDDSLQWTPPQQLAPGEEGFEGVAEAAVVPASPPAPEDEEGRPVAPPSPSFLQRRLAGAQWAEGWDRVDEEDPQPQPERQPSDGPPQVHGSPLSPLAGPTSRGGFVPGSPPQPALGSPLMPGGMLSSRFSFPAPEPAAAPPTSHIAQQAGRLGGPGSGPKRQIQLPRLEPLQALAYGTRQPAPPQGSPALDPGRPDARKRPRTDPSPAAPQPALPLPESGSSPENNTPDIGAPRRR
ncbi:putative cell cycle checkpoint protein [Paratrimastix pyriformis]|uniref:Cell cycle checkpoint protein n=1 Tax=Paratrimastix pyriformis TaxID=342808 RepID=A0ABQ8UQ23_9EUKA|nr:putative cell cycle checkpoint protein [Paratrimastix pyriformis]